MVCPICAWSPAELHYPFLFETELWRVVLAPNQSLLGRCVVQLKRHEGDLANQTEAELREWLKVVGILEAALRSAFGVRGDDVQLVLLHESLVPRRALRAAYSLVGGASIRPSGFSRQSGLHGPPLWQPLRSRALSNSIGRTWSRDHNAAKEIFGASLMLWIGCCGSASFTSHPLPSH